jgi:hypothetical protein
MENTDYKIIECCKKLSEALEGEMFDIMDNEPFLSDKIEPILVVLSDGGHGGICPIKFCPFCGKKIEILKPELF